MDPIFYNVNEDGFAYDRHYSWDAAYAVLVEYPNDSVVVVNAGSSMDDTYSDEVSCSNGMES